ncbi:MAG: HAMP domain-containing protein [bacterium]|nr:HAMP domain-containing protein [bacterium]
MKIFSSGKTKLVAWFVGSIQILIIAFSAILYMAIKDNLLTRIDSSLETVAKKRRADILEGLEEFGKITEEDLEDIYSLEEENIIFSLAFVQLLKAKPGHSHDAATNLLENFEVTASSRNLAGKRLPLLVAEDDADQHIYFKSFNDKTPIDENEKNQYIYFESFSDKRLAEGPLRLVTLSFDAEPDDHYIVLLATSQAEEEKLMNGLLTLILVVIPIMPLFLFLGGFFLVTKTLEPVKAVVASAQKITAEDLSFRIPSIGTKDEIGELVDTFNDMIARLDISIEKIKQFSSDVAHEFRTPLTVLRGEIEVLLRKERPVKDYKAALASFHEETLALQKIIENLLFLDGGEDEQDSFLFNELSVEKIILEALEETQPAAKRKNIRFVLGEMDVCGISGEETLLKRVFFNLFENACKYTEEGGRVEIRLQKKEDISCFTIKDTGIGISQEQLPFIFDRFYRVDKSRSRRLEGSGLGLSIVKRIVHLHNGTIEVRSEPGKGSEFTLHFPLPPRPEAGPAVPH